MHFLIRPRMKKRIEKTNNGGNFQSTKFSATDFFLIDRRNLFTYTAKLSLKSSSCQFSLSALRNTINYQSFSFFILVFFLFKEILNVTVCNKFFSVLASWRLICHSFINMTEWHIRHATCQQLIGNIKHFVKINMVFFFVLLLLFSGLEILVTPEFIW